jgi:hypothetical protein
LFSFFEVVPELVGVEGEITGGALDSAFDWRVDLYEEGFELVVFEALPAEGAIGDLAFFVGEVIGRVLEDEIFLGGEGSAEAGNYLILVFELVEEVFGFGLEVFELLLELGVVGFFGEFQGVLDIFGYAHFSSPRRISIRPN